MGPLPIPLRSVPDSTKLLFERKIGLKRTRPKLFLFCTRELRQLRLLRSPLLQAQQIVQPDNKLSKGVRVMAKKVKEAEPQVEGAPSERKQALEVALSTI